MYMSILQNKNKDNRKLPQNGKNLYYGFIGLAATILGFIAKVFFREYVFINNINDFGLSGFLPSLLYVIGFSQLLLIKPIKHPWVVVMFVTAGAISYEFMQFYSNGILDVKDILASLIGGIISLVICYQRIN